MQIVTFIIRGNADEMSVHFDVPFDYTIDVSKAKTPGTENGLTIILLTDLAESAKLSPYVREN
jgi:hypothetical protein